MCMSFELPAPACALLKASDLVQATKASLDCQIACELINEYPSF